MSPETRTDPAEPAGRRILLVDDNRDAADSLALLLGLEGHDVRVAYAGRPAIQVAHEFQPEILVTQQGCDTHALDPLANLTLSVDGQRRAYQELHTLAQKTAGGRWLLFGGGGYGLVHVVPRAWSHLLGEAAGTPIDPEIETPQGWRALVRERTGELAPLYMTDGREVFFVPFEQGYDPGNSVDRAIQATRTAVFPSQGIDPTL